LFIITLTIVAARIYQKEEASSENYNPSNHNNILIVCNKYGRICLRHNIVGKAFFKKSWQ